jgi:hypothetical protein
MFWEHVKQCDGKLKQKVKLPPIALPYLPHVFNNKEYAEALANGKGYEPIRTYITYDFETVLEPKNKSFGSGSMWISALHPITVAWTVKSPTKSTSYSLYRADMSIFDFIQKWLNQMLESVSDIEDKQINVIGYNSARFDTHLILNHLASEDWTLKTLLGNVKMLILEHKNEKQFRFIDLMGFLSGGTLDQNAQAFNPSAGREKGYFPYEFLTTDNYITELNKSEPFTHESFYSSLKQSNISTDEYQTYLRESESKNRLEYLL